MGANRAGFMKIGNGVARNHGGTFRHRDSIGWWRVAIVVRPSKRAPRSIKPDAAPPSVRRLMATHQDCGGRV